MLKRMPQDAIFRANPVNAFAVRIGLGRRFICGFFTDAIHFLWAHPLVVLLFGILVLAVPAHFFRDLLLGFVRVAVFFQQFHVFVRARVGLLQKLFVIMFVPFGLRILL